MDREFISRPELPISFPPRHGEGARGYIRRLAAENGYLRFKPFCSAISISASMGALSPDRLWARLAVQTGLDVGTFDRIRWLMDPLDRNALTRALGSTFSRTFLHSTTLRLCPRCLEEDLYLRELWSLSYYVACPRHQIFLLDRCPSCDTALDPELGGPWTCCCSREYRGFEHRTAPPAAVKAAAMMETLLEAEGGATAPLDRPKLGDHEFRTAHDYLTSLHLLGRAATTPAEKDPPYSPDWLVYRKGDVGSIPLEVEIQRVVAAADIMTNWPRGYWALLDRIRNRNPAAALSSPVRAAFATEIGYSLLYPLRASNGLPLPPLHNESQRYCVERMAIRRTARNLSTHHPLALRLYSLVNLTSVARACGVAASRTLLRRCFVRTLDGITTSEAAMSDQELAALVQARAEALFRRCEASLSASRVRALLEGYDDRTGLSAWEAPDLLPAAADLAGLMWDRAYDADDVERTLDRLRNIAVPLSGEHSLTPLPTAIKMAGILGTTYGKTDMLRDIFSGRLPTFTAAARPRLADLVVEVAEWQEFHRHRLGQEREQRHEYAAYKVMNRILAERFEGAYQLGLSEYRALRKSGQVRILKEETPRQGRPTLRPAYKYHVRDVIELVERRQRLAGYSAHANSSSREMASPTKLGEEVVACIE